MWDAQAGGSRVLLRLTPKGYKMMKINQYEDKETNLQPGTVNLEPDNLTIYEGRRKYFSLQPK